MAMRGRGFGIGGYRPPQPPMRTVSQTFRPKSDWRDEPNSAILILYLPGFIGEQIQVRRYPGEESIQVVAERRPANNRLIRVNETFTTPVGTDLEKLETNFFRGILTVQMPKKKEEPSKPIDHNTNTNHTPTQLSASTPTATPNPNSKPTATHTPTLAPTPITQPNLIDQKQPTPTPTATPNPYSNPTTIHKPEPTPTPTPTTMPTRTPTFAVQPINEVKALHTMVLGTKDTKVLAPENNDPPIQPKHSKQDQRSQEKEDQSKKKADGKIMREPEMKEISRQREMELILSPREKRQLMVNMGLAALLILGFIASAYLKLAN